MSFFSSLLGGQNGNLNTAIGQTGQIGGWATGQGQGDIGKATDFYSAILSGDASKTARALAPQISDAKVSNQQNQKTASMFGGRSGGTAASTAASDDKTHADITNLIGSLTNSSAGALGSMGSSLLNTGLAGITSSAELSQQRLSNWSNSILGGLTGGIAGTLGKAAGGALGMIPGLSSVI